MQILCTIMQRILSLLSKINAAILKALSLLVIKRGKTSLLPFSMYILILTIHSFFYFLLHADKVSFSSYLHSDLRSFLLLYSCIGMSGQGVLLSILLVLSMMSCLPDLQLFLASYVASSHRLQCHYYY